MTTYTLSISIDYTLEGELLEEYLEQLDDYEDTESQRKWFLLDRFAELDYHAGRPIRLGFDPIRLDPQANVTITKKEN